MRSVAALLILSCTASFDRSRIAQGGPTEGAAARPEGFEVCRVTTLEDSGEGSLRACVAEGREIVFDVSGVITLMDVIDIPSFVTIRGETADVSLVRAGSGSATVFELDESRDVILRGLRLLASSREGTSNALVAICTATRVHLDRMAIRNARAGLVIAGGTTDLLVSSSIFGESNTGVNVHGLPGGCASTNNARIKLARNVFHRVNERSPRLGGGANGVVLVNNIVYGWHWFEAGDAALTLAEQDGSVPSQIDVVANAWLAASGPPEAAAQVSPGVTLYEADNRLPSGESGLGGDASEAHNDVGPIVDFESVLDSAGPPTLDDTERGWLEVVRGAL